MMNEELLSNMKKLAIADGIMIDSLAREYNVNQNLLLKFHIEHLKKIVEGMDRERYE